MAHRKTIKIILSLTISNLLALSIISCSIKEIKLDHTPIKNADFLLPPDELIEKFPDIAGYHLPNPGKDRPRTDFITRPPTIKQLEMMWGKPDLIEKSSSEKYRFFTQPLFSFSFVALPKPIFSGLFFTIGFANHLLKDPLKRRVWYKGDYRIEIDENPYERQVWIWDWYHQSVQNGQAPLIKYGRTGWYGATTISGVSDIERTSQGSERFYTLLGFGHQNSGTRIFDNLYVDTLFSFNSFTTEYLYIFDLTQQLVSASITWNVDNNSKEVGFGVWYDTSIFDAVKYGYAGKAGGFLEFTYLKTKNTQFGFKLGNAYDFGGLDAHTNYLKLHLFIRDYKIDSL